MKQNEIIIEAKFAYAIEHLMKQKGYRLLGKGQDQDAYLAPDGTILKIFGTEYDSRSYKYTTAQQSFIDFADYCMKHENNPFLPQFFGWERFEFPEGSGRYYLQISSERLFEFSKAIDIAYSLSDLASSPSTASHYLQNTNTPGMNKLVLLVGGEKNAKLLITALKDLKAIALKKGYVFDLHGGNFMLGSDGQIVINDPFYTGSFRNYI